MTDELDIPTLFPSKLDDEPGPAEPLTAAETDALVANAMAACGLPAVGTVPHPTTNAPLSQPGSPPPPAPQPIAPPTLRVVSSPPTGPRRSATKRAVPVAVVVAALGFSSAAAALSGYWAPVVRQWVNNWDNPSDSNGVTASAPDRKKAPAQAQRNKAAEDPTVRESQDEPTAAEEAPAPGSVSRSNLLSEKLGRREAPHRTGSSRVVASPPEKSPEAQAGSQRMDPLAVANALRAQQRYDAALAKYLEIVKRGTSKRSSIAARVSAATLLLRQQRAAEAKRLLVPIATGSSAMPEAVHLLARAQEGAGDRAAAMRTLRRFIRSYPDHPSRRRASARLAKLSGTH